MQMKASARSCLLSSWCTDEVLALDQPSEALSIK